MTKRSDERATFLANVLTTAIEGGINYWADVLEYEWGFSDLGTNKGQRHEGQDHARAVVIDNEDEDSEPMVVDLEVVARGLGLVREKFAGRAALKLADRTNGDDGDFDAWDADAVVQLGLFGEVVYG